MNMLDSGIVLHGNSCNGREPTLNGVGHFAQFVGLGFNTPKTKIMSSYVQPGVQQGGSLLVEVDNLKDLAPSPFITTCQFYVEPDCRIILATAMLAISARVYQAILRTNLICVVK